MMTIRAVKVMLLVFSLAAIFSLFSMAASEQDGDYNGNGILDSNDYVLLKIGILSKDTSLPGDLNEDGELDVRDAAFLRSMLFCGKSVVGSYSDSLPIYYEMHDTYIIVNSAYSESADISVSFGIQTANALPDFKSVSLIEDCNGTVTAKTVGGKQIFKQGSDFFAPYTVAAVSDANGNVYEKKAVTGGNHANGYNKTANNLYFDVYADGDLLGNGDFGYTDSLTFSWGNRVQAWNTVLADGSGREVLTEAILMSFDGSRWEVKKKITASEDILIQNHHGLQFSLRYVSKKTGIFLFEGSKATEQAIAISDIGSEYTYPNDKTATSILIYDNNNAARFGIDPTDLGDFSACVSISSNCYASASKLWFFRNFGV